MSIDLCLSNGEPLAFSPGLPTDYSGPRLRGAVSSYSHSKTLKIVIQDFLGEGFSIRIALADFFRKVTLHNKIKYRGLYFNLSLKGEMRKKHSSLEPVDLIQDKYTLYHTSPAICAGTFTKNTEHTQITICYSPKFLDHLQQCYPTISYPEYFATDSIEPIKAFWCSRLIHNSIRQILHCPYDDDFAHFYFDLKVREILLALLDTSGTSSSMPFLFTPFEKDKLHQAQAILESHVSSKPPSVKQLSQLVLLNENKLRTGFRQLFDTGITGYILEKKMLHARQLLLETEMPIKEVSSLVGYPRTTNFITAFRKRFGITPGALRRK